MILFPIENLNNINEITYEMHLRRIKYLLIALLSNFNNINKNYLINMKNQILGLFISNF